MTKRRVEKTAHVISKWIGSMSSLVVHTLCFFSAFLLIFFGVSRDEILLVLTTVVSLEAIYLAIFIQMTVNRTTESLEEVEDDIDEIQKDVDEIAEDVDEIQKDVDEIQEDVGEMTEEEKREAADRVTLDTIKSSLQNIMSDLEKIKKNN